MTTTAIFLCRKFHGQRSLGGTTVHEATKSWTRLSTHTQQNSHHTQHSSHSCLNSNEVLWLTVLHISLLPCNNLSLIISLPSVTNQVPHDCLMLMDHLLNSSNDLKEIPLCNISFSWFPDGSYLKGDDGKYCVGYAITTLYDAVEAASLSMTTSAQYTKLYALSWACTLGKDKTANIYTISTHAFEVLHDFRMWKQHGFLLPGEIKF